MSAYKYKLYVVTWGDAWGDGDMYYDERGSHTPIVMTDVGWLCENTEETIVLCSTFSEAGLRRGVTCIPHVNIIKIEELT